MNYTITTAQANSEWYSENSQVLEKEETGNDIYTCIHCHDIIEDESNVYWENNQAFCSQKCYNDYIVKRIIVDRIHEILDEQDRINTIRGEICQI